MILVNNVLDLLVHVCTLFGSELATEITLKQPFSFCSDMKREGGREGGEGGRELEGREGGEGGRELEGREGGWETSCSRNSNVYMEVYPGRVSRKCIQGIYQII